MVVPDGREAAETAWRKVAPAVGHRATGVRMARQATSSG
jgi:hypothetical protein